MPVQRGPHRRGHQPETHTPSGLRLQSPFLLQRLSPPPHSRLLPYLRAALDCQESLNSTPEPQGLICIPLPPKIPQCSLFPRARPAP